ncbi:transposon Ty3-I Gag-Pol polyprotein [Trichonephila clavipes]|uniref:Transposon Ty3-I Gag-Pol polyprotein n=1 Tax=Trichonephila clavipes TaxID=2585209 RepID=A0A8X6VBJ7_TRICX|nr:transposon Ty3-I Gag-Pol polyprotein [Trichonephila clavipes]
MDQHTRWPEAAPLRSLTAKTACDFLLQIFSRTGIPSIIASDQGTNFKSALTQEFTKRIGSSPRFSCPGYPASNGLVEK